MRRVFVSFVCLFAAGCGGRTGALGSTDPSGGSTGGASGSGGGGAGATGAPSPENPPLTRSGTRLRAVYVDLGGARRFETWFDTKLGVQCDFARTSDGKMRCVPRGFYEPDTFADASCTKRAIRVVDESSACGWPAPVAPLVPYATFRAVTSPDASTCEGLFHVDVYRFGATTTAPLYAMSDSCVKEGPQQLPGTSYLLEPLDPGELVAGTRRAGDGDHGVAPLIVDGEDGSMHVWGILDVARDTTCDTSKMADTDDLRCLPCGTESAFQDGFSDVACSIPLGQELPPGSFPTPHDYVLPDSCSGGSLDGDANRLFRPIGAETTSFYVATADGTCAGPVSLKTPLPLLAPLAPDKFPATQRSLVGTTLAAREERTPGGKFLFRSGLYRPDGGECAFVYGPDGVLRCSVGGRLHPPRYADAACTDEVVGLGGGCPVPSQYLFYFSPGGDICSQPNVITDEVKAPVFFWNDGAGCVPVPDSEQSGRFFHFTKSPELGSYPAINFVMD